VSRRLERGSWSKIFRVATILDAAVVDRGADHASFGRGVTTARPALPGSGTVGELTGQAPDVFEVGWLTEDGVAHRAELADVWPVGFETMAPVRKFSSRKGQRHLPGRWWSATDGCHVGYESWLERDHVMLLDFDPVVVGIASQPLWLSWTTEDGTVRSHAPDYFARRADGSALVVDCRPVGRRKPRDVAAFEATRSACELVGWDYRLVGALEAVLVGNVRWLAGYRHPRHRVPELLGPVRAAFAEPAPLMATAESVGDPIAVLPVLFHLLWRQELVTDLAVPLHPAVTVTRVVA
jgi:hypothetical protein